MARVCPVKKLIFLQSSSSILLCLFSGSAFSSLSRSLFIVAALLPDGLPPFYMIQLQLSNEELQAQKTTQNTSLD